MLVTQLFLTIRAEIIITANAAFVTYSNNGADSTPITSNIEMFN
jgi:hypothetical protein